MRLIDANKLGSKVCKLFLCAELGSLEESCFYIMLGLINSEPTIDPQPNEPLTLEELRGMDGEPIYIPKVGWRICYGVDETGSVATVKVGRTTRMYDYGKTWLAYRRKPEEGSA